MNKTGNMQHRVSLQWEEICYDGMQAFDEGLSLIAVRTERENRTCQWAQNGQGIIYIRDLKELFECLPVRRVKQMEGIASERPIVKTGTQGKPLWLEAGT